MTDWPILIFVVITFLSFTGCLALERQSHKLGLMDSPGERKLQTTPIPRSGGMVIFILYLLFSSSISFSIPNTFLIGALVVYLGGLYDDYISINKVSIKVVFQVIAVLLAATNFYLQYDLPPSILVIGVGFMFLMINSFNLMDNMNGLTAGMSFVLIVFFYASGFTTLYEMLALTGALAGFLLRNFPRGHIFLGDQGSQLLGYLMSGFALRALAPHFVTGGRVTDWAFASILLVVGFLPFIVDTIVVVVIRIKNKQSIMKGDQNHLSHQLVRRGFSLVFAPLVLVGFHALCAIICYYCLTHVLPNSF